MTKINRLTIHGFKSFAHKTDVLMGEKYNCILGPNGSGKSNVGDAICFVLGRLSAKSMRAERAANLIFNGGKKKTPAKQGSVEIVFDNSNHIFPEKEKEIVLNRTITKSGSSIYKINGKKRTRTEILDLLSAAKINPDGYNIILQGDITRFVDMPPVERRKIIEEISDISHYEEKKRKALLELGKVDEKLNSAGIILKERSTYLRELKKDRDQALKFKELKDKVSSNKATYLNIRIKEKTKQKDKFDQETNLFQEKINKAEEKIKKHKENLNSKKQQIQNLNKEIETKGETQQLQVHRQIEDLKVQLAKDKTRISTLKDEIVKIKQRKLQFKEEIKEIEQKTDSSNKRQQDLGKKLEFRNKEQQQIIQQIEQFKKKHKIETSQELEKEIEDKDKLIETRQEEVQKIRQEQQELLREKDRIEYHLQSIDDRIKKVKEVEQQNKGQIQDLKNKKSEFKNTTIRLNDSINQDGSFASQLSNARKKLVSLQEQQAKLGTKAASIREGLAGNMAVRRILENKKKFKGVYGTVAELGSVNRKFSLALETAAGGKTQFLVVEDDRTAAECIRYLKSNKLGSAAFIPLNKIRFKEVSPQEKNLLSTSGVHDFAINLIKFKPQFKKAFSYVFGNTLIVDNIDTARKVGIGKAKMATLEGDVAEGSGVMRGGFRQSRRNSGFVEKDTLEELDKVEMEISGLRSVVSAAEVKREANEKEISFLRNKKSELEAEIIKLEKTLHLDNTDLDASKDQKQELTNNLKEVDKKLENFQSTISSTNKGLAELKSKKMILRSKITELRNPRLLAQLSAFEETRQNGRETIVSIKSELKNISTQVDELIAPEKEKILTILKQHDKEETQFQEEIKTLSEKTNKKEKELTEKEKESVQFYTKYRELFNKRDQLNNQTNDLDKNVEILRERMRGNEIEINKISLRNAEVKAKLAAINEEFQQYKNAPLLKNKSEEELRKEISKFEVMLTQMSAVNMKALEIYEKVEEEYEKLIEKKDSLHGEHKEIMSFMGEIETKKKEQFLTTFKHANDNFKKVFSRLFKKGTAHLELEDPNNIFENGLTIKVRITGNRFMDIKSLSGGEKTLTALSFIFAVQEHQPATFYILDEIDAALDKHNSETLSKLIRAYADRAQYIIISHNDSVISEADNLYGVSMNEGVSKVTSLKI